MCEIERERERERKDKEGSVCVSVNEGMRERVKTKIGIGFSVTFKRANTHFFAKKEKIEIPFFLVEENAFFATQCHQ